MAWPLSRIDTFISRSVPRISAAFLNLVQDTVNQLFNGVISLKSLIVDNTGGNVVAPSGATIGPTYPSAAPAPGEYVKHGEVAALAHVSGGFVPPLGAAGQGLLAGFGIHDMTRVGAGEYNITFSRQPSGGSADNSVVQATGGLGQGAPEITKSIAAGRLVANVKFAGAVDVPFNVTAWIF